jgi:GAF domain-containing protein
MPKPPPADASRPPRRGPGPKVGIGAVLSAIADSAWAGQHAQAVAQADAALAMAGLGAAQRAELLDRRADSHLALGHTAQALADAQAMLEQADTPLLQAQAQCRLAAVCLRQSQWAAAATAAHQALAEARRARQRRLQAMALFRLSEAQFRQYDNAAALRSAKKSAALFEALGDPVWQGRALWAQAYAHDQIGQARERERAGLASLALAQRTGDNEGIGAAANLVYREHADMAQRLKGLKESLAAFIAAGQPERAGASLGNLAMAYGSIGLYARARNPGGRDSGIESITGLREQTPYFSTMLSVIEGQLGHRELARQYAEQAAAAADQTDDHWFKVIVHLVQGRAARLYGEVSAARKHFEQAVALSSARGDRTLVVIALTELGSLLVDTGDAVAALAATRQAVAQLHARGDAGLGSMFTPASAWWWHTRALQANGLQAQARQALATSYRVMLDGVANLSDEGLRRSWFNKVQAHRQLILAWLAEGRRRRLPSARYLAHLSAHTQLREPFERLVDTGVRLNELHNAAALNEFLVEEATELSGAERVLLVLAEGDELAIAGSLLPPGEDAAALLRAIEPWLEEARHTRLARLRHGPEGAEAVDQRSCLVAPLVAQRQLLGFLYADIEGAFGRFHESDADLLGMLAAQAAVALANLRASEGLEAKVAERTAQLEQRAGELALINRIQQGIAAELDFQAVVDLVGDMLSEVFTERDVSIFWWDDATGLSRGLYVRLHGQRVSVQPVRPDPEGRIAKAFAQGRTVVANNAAEMDAWGMRAIEGKQLAKSTALVPIMLGDRRIGTLGLNDHARENAFGEAEVGLLQTVAASLGVGLENARLHSETQDALARQTASAQVMQAINSSIADARPVFDAIMEGCSQLLPGTQQTLTLVDEAQGTMVLAAHNGPARAQLERHFPIPLSESLLVRHPGGPGQVMRYDTVLDNADAPAWLKGLIESMRIGDCSMVFVPLRRDDRDVGRLTVVRYPPAPFTDAEVAMLRTFADQAVIAIQNAKLFNETKEALERQTATAEVLEVISGSVADTQPVFDKILGSCASLFHSSEQGVVLLGAEGFVEIAAHHGPALPGLKSYYAKHRVPNKAYAPAIIEGRTIIVRNALDPQLHWTLRNVAEHLQIGPYSQLLAPMVWEGQAIGWLYVIRQPANGFSDKEAALLETFADQAVIAIQNARLFNETKEALELQTTSAEVLRVVGESMADAQPVFDSVCASLERLLPGTELAISARGSDGRLHWRAGSGEHAQALRQLFPRPAPGKLITGVPSYWPDLAHGPDVPDSLREAVGILGRNASMLSAAMTSEGEVVGALSALRFDLRPFSEKESRMLKAFADQAVIAIQNARLFNETQEALARQTATADMLRVISSSPTDVQPVFDAIVSTAVRLIGCDKAFVLHLDGQRLRLAAGAGKDGLIANLADKSIPVDPGANFPSRVVVDKQALHLPDWAAIELPELRAPRARVGRRQRVADASLAARRRMHRRALLGRARAVAFTAAEIALAESFRDQARDRDPERAAVPRDPRGAGQPDGERRDPARDEPLAHRRAAGVRGDRRQRGEAAGVRLGLRHAPRRQHLLGGGGGHAGRAAHRPARGSSDRPAAEFPVAGDGREEDAAPARLVGDRAAGIPARDRREVRHPGGAAAADAARRRVPSACSASPTGAGRVQRKGDRAGGVVPRPGADRDRERAPVQRDARGAGAADGHRRHPARDQQPRPPTCSRCSTPWSAPR